MYHSDSNWSNCYVNQEKGIAVFDDIVIESDPITDPREERILAILEEEQVFMCRQMRPNLKKGAFVLDVGTGSGVYAIEAAKRGCKVIAVDISPRAIAQTQHNAHLNQIKICQNLDDLEDGTIYLILESFGSNFLENLAINKNFNVQNLFDLVFLAPPYNPTCPGVFPALHAAAGEDGQRAFEEQIKIVPSVLKEEGICIGNQMTLFEKGTIQALKTIQNTFETCEIQYVHILGENQKYFSVEEFLKQQYANYLVDEQDSILSSESHLPSKKDVQDYINIVSYGERDIDGKYFIDETKSESDINRNFALIYFEIKKAKINQIQEKQSEFRPRKTGENRIINWEDRIFLHKNIVEHACPMRRFKIPSLFLSDFPHPFSINHFSCDEPESVRGSRIRLIEGIIKYYNLLKEFDIIFLDTAPVYRILGGYERLPEVCHVWLSEDLISPDLNQNLIEEWHLNTICQQQSSIAPFHHPIFTGACAKGNWSELLYSDNIKGLGYFQYNDPEEIEFQKEYDEWINNGVWTNNNTKQKNQQKRDDFLKYLNLKYSQQGFSEATLGHLYVPLLEDYYNDFKNSQVFPALKNKEISKQIIKKFDCDFLIDRYQGDFFKALSDKNLESKEKAKILQLLQNDLEHRHLTMHKQIDARYSQYVDNIKFSSLIGLPLSLKTEPFLKKDKNSQNLNFEIPDTYRGGIWLYVASQKIPNVKLQQMILDLIRFTWLLYLDEYTTDVVEASIPVAKTQVLHQLPKDLAALESYLLSFQKDLNKVQSQNPSLEIPKLIMPDSLGVMTMLAQAADPQAKTRKLIELPEDCSQILYQEWNVENIQYFVNRIVWLVAANRAYSDERIVKAKEDGFKVASIDEIKSQKLAPKLVIEDSFSLKNPRGIYPLILCVLRNAYQHSLLQILLNNFSEQGIVKINYRVIDEAFEELIISNTGIQPEHEMKHQSGLERDLAIFDKLTNNWKVQHCINGQVRYSKYDESLKMWVTKIVRQ